jgi:hypothetical protein
VLPNQGELGFQSQETLLCALFSLTQELQRQVCELGLQRGYLRLHLYESLSQITVSLSGGRPTALNHVWLEADTFRRRLKNSTMQTSEQVDLLAGQALDSRICRMGVKRDLSLG